MAGPLMEAWDDFRAAAEARRSDLRNPEKAAALVAARARLEEALKSALQRVPYRTRRVGDLRPGRDGGQVHLALAGEVSLQGWRRRAGQTLCGDAPGRPAPDRPVTCGACLRLAERHQGVELDPPELGL
jgi:hypothetical protein